MCQFVSYLSIEGVCNLAKVGMRGMFVCFFEILIEEESKMGSVPNGVPSCNVECKFFLSSVDFP